MENAQPEQSMEEILASIRRIISEDEEGGEAAKTPPQDPASQASASQASTKAPSQPEAAQPVPAAPEALKSESFESGPEGPAADEPVLRAAAPDPAPSEPPAPAAEADQRTGPVDAAAPLDMPLQTEGLEMLKKNVEAGVAEGQDALILDQTAAAAASQAFESLSQSVRVADTDSRTLEDIVVAMLQPMVKEWLDANLPAIVEEKVEQEVQRVSRRR